MPQLIRTPEQIFREEAKSIYVIQFKNYDDDESGESAEDCEDKKISASEEIKAWIAKNLPGTLIEPMGPSEHSGWIIGYFGDLRIDFPEDGLKQFCAKWEAPDGASVDDRFQCYLMPYQRWFEEYGHYVPSNQQPITIGVTVWIDTPIGFIYHQLDENVSVDRHPAKPADLWMHAVRLWPELKEMVFCKLTHGTIRRNADKTSWEVWYSDEPMSSYEFTDKRQAALREWFRLPAGVEILNEWG